MINTYIEALVQYAVEKELITEEDRIFAVNRILEILHLEDYEPSRDNLPNDLETILAGLLDFACEKGLCENSVHQRDLFDTKIMGALTPFPHEVRSKFFTLYKNEPVLATDYFYNLCRNSDYIRQYRIAKDLKWTYDSQYGTLDITINLSKPEKDPKAIAAAKLATPKHYPKCLLCAENEGLAGRLNHPARQNHRIIPITINNCSWFFQYSPYVYYNEHCIVFNSEHIPMKVESRTFRKLLDFVALFPHYFVGSNADLPIVGGSILSHDHFQGGRYTFAMARAPEETQLTFTEFNDVKAGIVRWPMSVIRLASANSDRLVALATKILTCWRQYTDPEAFIFAETNGEPHNTITPIARKKGDLFELDLVLRNNITTPEHPLGLYHPHAELHHIKKENIGLIEVMGLAVLPARLKKEMTDLRIALIKGLPLRGNQELEKHADWIESLTQKYVFTEENTEEILKREIGAVFEKVLENAGVYARSEAGKAAFLRFIEAVNAVKR